ncbi:DUF3471 domain-containing protein, partial [Acinetobacter baumannii]|nr:DUF3471 domain-containing protein [Acinetobacter baumannii]
MGKPQADWPATFQAYKAKKVKQGLDLLKSKQATPVKSRPSLPPAALVGSYADPWYGKLAISQEKTGLRVDFMSTQR